MTALAPYRKAIAAFAVTYAGVLYPLVEAHGSLTWQLAVQALIAAVAAGGATYVVPNQTDHAAALVDDLRTAERQLKAVQDAAARVKLSAYPAPAPEAAVPAALPEAS